MDNDEPLIQVKSMSSRGELISLLEEILPRAQFYPRTRRSLRPPDSVFLNSEDYRTEHHQVKFDALMGHRMPIPSDFIRPIPDVDRFPEDHFARLVGLVEQLLDPYTDPDSQRFVAVLPATRVYQGNLGKSVEQFSKSIVRCAALFGVSETVDAVLRLGPVHTMRIGVIIGEWNSHKTSTNASLLSYQYSEEM